MGTEVQKEVDDSSKFRDKFFYSQAALFIGLSCFDLATTSHGLSLGFTEKNPLISHLIDNYGFMGFIAVKTLHTSLGLSFFSFSRNRFFTRSNICSYGLFAMNLELGITSVSNTLNILFSSPH